MKTEHIIIIVIIILVLALIYRDTYKNSEQFDPSGNHIITFRRNDITDLMNRLNAIVLANPPSGNQLITVKSKDITDIMNRIDAIVLANRPPPAQDGVYNHKTLVSELNELLNRISIINSITIDTDKNIDTIYKEYFPIKIRELLTQINPNTKYQNLYNAIIFCIKVTTKIKFKFGLPVTTSENNQFGDAVKYIIYYNTTKL
jgi:hypothetical protein